MSIVLLSNLRYVHAKKMKNSEPMIELGCHKIFSADCCSAATHVVLLGNYLNNGVFYHVNTMLVIIYLDIECVDQPPQPADINRTVFVKPEYVYGDMAQYTAFPPGNNQCYEIMSRRVRLTQ